MSAWQCWGTEGGACDVRVHGGGSGRDRGGGDREGSGRNHPGSAPPRPSPLTTNQPPFITPLITRLGSRTAVLHMLIRLASY